MGSGMGVTIAFDDSEFAGQITGISGGDLVREWYDTTHFGAAAGVDFDGCRWMLQEPGDLASVNDIVVEILYNIDLLPPIDQPSEMITIQCPPKVGQTTGGKIVLHGGMKQYGGPSLTMRDTRRGQYILAVTGPPEFTAGS